MSAAIAQCLLGSYNAFEGRYTSVAVNTSRTPVLAANPMRTLLVFWVVGAGDLVVGPEGVTIPELPFDVNEPGDAITFHIEVHKAMIQRAWLASPRIVGTLQIYEEIYTG